jgi:hypothetical protein
MDVVYRLRISNTGHFIPCEQRGAKAARPGDIPFSSASSGHSWLGVFSGSAAIEQRTSMAPQPVW